MENKTCILKVRVTPSDMKEIRYRAQYFGTMSNYVHQALKEFSDTTSKQKLEMSKTLAEKYSDLDYKLAHIGGNLNQAMRRVNERAIAGITYDSLMYDTVLPEILNCIDLCHMVRAALKDVTNRLAK